MQIFGILSTFLMVLSVGIAVITFKNGVVLFVKKNTVSLKYRVLLSISYFLLAANYLYYNLLFSSALDNDIADIGGLFGDWHLAVLALQLFLIISLQLFISSHNDDAPLKQTKRAWSSITGLEAQRIHLVIVGILLVQLSLMAAL